PVGQADEGVEGGVVEDPPPVAVGRRRALCAGVVRLDPRRRHGRRRPAVLGPDLEPVVGPLPEVVGDAPAWEQGGDRQAGQGGPASRAREGPVHGLGSLVTVHALSPARTLRPADRTPPAQSNLSAGSAPPSEKNPAGGAAEATALPSPPILCGLF